MSRMLKSRRGLSALRSLRLEVLETRIAMHGESLLMADSPTSLEPQVEAASQPLDANGDGRIQLGELRDWLSRQRDAHESLTRQPTADNSSPSPPQVLPDVPDFGGGNDWHLNSIDAPEAWAEGYTGQGVVVAVIDTGADLRHREIRNNLWVNADETPGNGRDDDGNGYVDDVHGWDFVNNDRVPQDRNGHGTHVASLIVGARDGVGVTGAAYDSELMVLQGLGSNGVGDTRDIARAVRYAVDEGADIINLSLSGASSPTLDAAIRYADQQGVLVVIASGNRGASQPSSPALLSREHSGVLSVGAHDSSGDLAAFSNRAADAVQVVAPGVSLRAAVPGGYARYSGTSMAAPLVTGVAALTLSAAPDLTSSELRQLLADGAGAGIDGDDSHGSVSAASTVAKALVASSQTTNVGAANASRSSSPAVRSLSGASHLRQTAVASSSIPRLARRVAAPSHVQFRQPRAMPVMPTLQAPDVDDFFARWS